MAEDLYKNADPGHCVICGQEARQDLCAKHSKEYRDQYGALPRWLRELRNEQHARTVQRSRTGGEREITVGLQPRSTVGS